MKIEFESSNRLYCVQTLMTRLLCIKLLERFLKAIEVPHIEGFQRIVENGKFWCLVLEDKNIWGTLKMSLLQQEYMTDIQS